MVTEVILLIVLLLLSAFFSGVETAMMSLSKIKVHSLMNEKRKGAKVLFKLKKNPHRLLITILIGNNLVNIGAASIATAVSISLFGEKGVGVATGVITLLVLVFGEITPKSYAIQNAEKLSLLLARPLEILEIILWPAVVIFENLTTMVNKLTGEKKPSLTEAELRSVIIMGKEEGVLDKEATERLNSVLDFEKTTVKQIMTPKAQVITLNANFTIQQFLDSVLDSPFDRYPLYEQNHENIVGILDVIDVIRALKDKKPETTLKELMRPTYFVKEDYRIDELLSQVKNREVSMGIVVDEKGEMVGVYTHQDIVEELVGDIFEKEIYKSHIVR